MKAALLAALAIVIAAVIGGLAFLNLANQLDHWEQQQPARDYGRANPLRVVR